MAHLAVPLTGDDHCTPWVILCKMPLALCSGALHLWTASYRLGIRFKSPLQPDCRVETCSTLSTMCLPEPQGGRKAREQPLPQISSNALALITMALPGLALRTSKAACTGDPSGPHATMGTLMANLQALSPWFAQTTKTLHSLNCCK